jgi:hypothetical protein
MHDGAPIHFSLVVLRVDVLSNIYHDERICRRGPTAWPPISQNLIPMDFYLWGQLETLVYAAPVDNEEALHHRNVDEIGRAHV